jgi:hypothetical protein
LIRVLILTTIVLIVAAIGYVVAALARRVERIGWPGETPQEQNHLGMARWIERQLGDDMIQVTIPEAQKREARRLLEKFYGERQIGEGD